MRLIVQNLDIKYAGITLLQRLNFTVQPGTLMTLHGANGIGKSTLLRTLAGLHKIAKGRAFMAYQGDEHPLAPFSHYLGEKNAMKPHLSLADNIGFWIKFYGADLQIMPSLFEEINLASLGHLPFHALSTGQKRRLGFMRLLLQYRPLWLLDEPNAGLDKMGEDFVAHQMHKHLEKGGMIIAATHLPLGIKPHQFLDLNDHQEGRPSRGAP